MGRPVSPVVATRVSNPKKSPRPTSAPMDLSFKERKMKTQGSTSTPVGLVEGDRLMRDIDRPLPGDVTRRASKSHSKPELAKKRSNVSFFEDTFSVGESSAAKERVRGDAIVMAEVKTNVIIGDEFTFITELSYHLSTRYQRPVSSIVVTLHHGACMFFGGSFDAAYVMSIFALPSQLLPTTNKRNAALIQKHMKEALGVDPSRGLLRFVPIKEEHMAFNGKTMAGEIDELERAYFSSPGTTTVTGETEGGAGTSSRRSRARKKLSVKSLKSFRPPSGVDVPAPELTPPASANETLPTIPASPELPPATLSLLDKDKPIITQQSITKKAKRKKSFVATIFSRSGSKSEYAPGLTTVRGDQS